VNKSHLLQQIKSELSKLDEEDLSALQEMLKESPALLRQTLIEYGYLADRTDSGERMITNSSDNQLSQAQQDLSEELDGRLDPPQTLTEIIEMVGSEDATFRQQYSSAQYRSWLNEQLNALVEAGKLGRYQDGRNVIYTETPALAVRHWTRVNERFIEGLSVTDAASINDETKMPVSVIREAIIELTSE
jgi:hypothetical protein